MEKKIRLILADDHPLIRAGFKSLLGKNKSFEIVGEASNGQELINLVEKLRPDVVLTDITMPLASGIEAMEQIFSRLIATKFIILTMHEEREYILNALKSGASGYILKDTERLELEKAIVTIYRGGKYFSPAVATIMAESIQKVESEETEEVTPREKEVLTLVAAGNSTKQIADKLKISIRTVESHRINMLKKLKVSNTAELIKKTIQLDII